MSYRSWPPFSGSYAPLTYVRGIPVDVTTLLVGIHIAAMVISAIAISLSGSSMMEAYAGIVSWFGFDAVSAIRGKVWTIFTYPFVHNIALEHLWFAINMLMFFWFGREVERYIGRSAYVWYYALLTVVPAVAVGIASTVLPTAPLFGSRYLHFAVFVGFVTIYPNVQFFFGLVAKWLAWGFLAIYSLSGLVQSDWVGLIHLWVSCGSAYFLLRSAGVGGGISLFESIGSWRDQRMEREIRQRREAHKRKVLAHEETVDAILEKISRNGMASLDAQERAILDKASRDLHSKEPS